MLYIFYYKLYIVDMYKHIYCHIIDKYVFSYLQVPNETYACLAIALTTRQQRTTSADELGPQLM